MVLRSIQSSASALQLAQLRQSSSANNVANSQTSGFKSSRVHAQTQGNGSGVGPSEVTLNLKQGPVKVTGRQLDLGIQGDGFFPVETENGQRFTRAGTFKVNGNGKLVSSQGFPVQPGISVPDRAESIQVQQNGEVVGTDQKGNSFAIGQIQVAKFNNPEGLVKEGQNLFRPGSNSGQPQLGEPGTGGRGSVISGALEQSNTNFIQETVNQIKNKHLFSLNIEALETADKMLEEVVNIGEDES